MKLTGTCSFLSAAIFALNFPTAPSLEAEGIETSPPLRLTKSSAGCYVKFGMWGMTSLGLRVWGIGIEI